MTIATFFLWMMTIVKIFYELPYRRHYHYFDAAAAAAAWRSHRNAWRSRPCEQCHYCSHRIHLQRRHVGDVEWVMSSSYWCCCCCHFSMGVGSFLALTSYYWEWQQHLQRYLDHNRCWRTATKYDDHSCLHRFVHNSNALASLQEQEAVAVDGDGVYEGHTHGCCSCCADELFHQRHELCCHCNSSSSCFLFHFISIQCNDLLIIPMLWYKMCWSSMFLTRGAFRWALFALIQFDIDFYDTSLGEGCIVVVKVRTWECLHASFSWLVKEFYWTSLFGIIRQEGIPVLMKLIYATT